MGVLARVVAVGLATVQDGGRRGLSHLGVPSSGALHRERYLVATALLAGLPDASMPAVELLSGDLALEATADVVLAVVGPATCRMDDRRAAVGTALLVPAGSVLAVRTTGPGPVYLVVDGWQPRLTLGSAATDTFSNLGGGALRAGESLRGVATRQGRARVGAFHRPLEVPTGRVRVVPTGHPGLRSFTAAAWVVGVAARSGVRLAGGLMRASAPIASMPVVPGAVQLPPDGAPIVLGPDGGLTGGYPVVAVVASADLDRMSLLGAGDTVSFRAVDQDEALVAWQSRQRALRAAVTHPADLP